MKKKNVLQKLAGALVEARLEKPRKMSKKEEQPTPEDPSLGSATISSKDIKKGSVTAIPGDKIKGMFEADVNEHSIEKTREGDKSRIGIRIKKLLIH
jgi:hypothetical protein